MSDTLFVVRGVALAENTGQEEDQIETLVATSDEAAYGAAIKLMGDYAKDGGWEDIDEDIIEEMIDLIEEKDFEGAIALWNDTFSFDITIERQKPHTELPSVKLIGLDHYEK